MSNQLEKIISAMDARVNELLKLWNLPGVSVTLVQDGKIAFCDAYGTRDIPENLPMTTKTHLPIGSVTKSFTALALGMLADEGKLDWDVPVCTYVPWLKLVDAVAENDCGRAIGLLSDLYNGGRDLISVLGELSAYLRDLLVYKVAGNSGINRMNLSLDNTTIEKHLQKFENNRLISALSTISDTMSTIGVSANKRIDAEICIIRLCTGIGKNDESALLQRIETLERAVANGAVTQPRKRQNSTNSPVTKPVESVENPAISKGKTEVKEEKTCAPAVDTGEKTFNWESILEAAKAELSPGLVPLLRTFEARVSNSQILLYSNNPLAKNILNHREQVAILERASEKVCGAKMRILIADEKSAPAEDEFSKLCEKLSGKENITIV